MFFSGKLYNLAPGCGGYVRSCAAVLLWILLT